MATSAMIEYASRGPSKPSTTPMGDLDALLRVGKTSQHAEAVELAKARRTVVRMALGRHACAGLDDEVCADDRHPIHVWDALTSLRVLGLAEDLPKTSRKCHGCKKAKPLSAFSPERATCDKCCAIERDRRTTKREAS